MSRKRTPKSVRIPFAALCISTALLLPIIGYTVYLQIKPDAQEQLIVQTETETPFPQIDPASSASTTPAATQEPLLVPAADATVEPKWQFQTSDERFWQDGILATESEYRSPDLYVSYRCVYDTETFHRRLTYFVAEVFVRDVTQIRTASFKDDFNKTGRGEVEETAGKNHALLAVSGDYYGFHNDSLVIRNGETYRAKLRKGDICLLQRDGSMEMIRGSEAKIDTILEKDPWQAWQFGPILLDASGNARTGFPESNLNKENPRCAIGYVEPGHYFFVVVDGRQKYSKGVTLTELAKLMKMLGCKQAFNLDGGASAHFYWNDRIMNNPSGGGRKISDIIYIAKETYDVSPYFPGKDGLSQ